MRWLSNNWITLITLFVSIGTLIALIYEININKKQRNKDREISVIVNERRKMQKELFSHLTSLLSIDRKLNSTKIKREEIREDIVAIQYHQINIWINLNIENQYELSLRIECDKLVGSLENFYEKLNIDSLDKYREESKILREKIWSLIESYVQEEEQIVRNILEE